MNASESNPKQVAPAASNHNALPHHHYLFTYAPTPTWLVDLSHIKRRIDEVRIAGTTDFKTYFETHPDEVRHCAESLRIIDVNQAGLVLLKTSAASEITEHPSTFFIKETWGDFRNLLIAIAQGALRMESIATLRDQSGATVITHLTLTVIPEFSETLSQALISFIDITEQTHLTKALKESEERFRTLLRDIPSVSVQGYNADGNVIFWNAASTTLYGYTIDEALGRNLTDLIIPPPMKTGVKAAINHMVATLQPIPAGPLNLMRKDGSMVPVYSSHAVMNIPGHGFELYCLDIDLSDLKRTEAALAQEKNTSTMLQQHLQQAAKMDAIGRLAGGVAHDFNNVLQAIMGFTEILLEQTRSDSSQYENLTQIQKAGIRASDLTRQLLAFSRKQMIEPRVFNINANVIGAQKILQRLLGENIQLTAITDPRLLPIKADPGQIDQVIMNLAVNARDAMPNGGQLTLRTSNVILNAEDIVSLPDAYPGTFICLSTSDTGTGMDSETLGHLFEPFFTTKEIGKGSGLGLAVIYGILMQNKGWINVQSQLGQGSTFDLYFPAYTGLEDSLSKQTVTKGFLPAPPCGNGECVLLVEDDPAVRELAATALQTNGYVVLQGRSAQEALELFDQNRDGVAVLFSDVVLPDITGIELAEQLLVMRPNLPVLFASGYADERARWSMIESKGYRFLQKPYPLVTLLHVIRELLNNKTTAANAE